jgi:5-methylcytosine-specific restriction protein A
VGRRTFRTPAPIYDLVRRSGEARVAVIDAILESFFPDMNYNTLLEDVALFDDEVADDLGDAGDAADRSIHPGAEYERLCRIAERGDNRPSGARVPQTTLDPVRSRRKARRRWPDE